MAPPSSQDPKIFVGQLWEADEGRKIRISRVDGGFATTRDALRSVHRQVACRRFFPDQNRYRVTYRLVSDDRFEPFNLRVGLAPLGQPDPGLSWAIEVPEDIVRIGQRLGEGGVDRIFAAKRIGLHRFEIFSSKEGPTLREVLVAAGSRWGAMNYQGFPPLVSFP